MLRSHVSRLLVILACLWPLAVTSTAQAAYDLSATFLEPGSFPNGQTDAGRPLTFKVKVVNNGPDAYPGGFSLSLNRFDHTGQQFLTAVGSAHPVATLAANASTEVTFTDENPPQGSYFYKVGFTPYFTDANNTNHTPDKFVKFVKPTLTVKVTSGKIQLIATPGGGGVCTSQCTYELPANASVRLAPVYSGTASAPAALVPKFRRWTTPTTPLACSGGAATAPCTFTFTRTVEVRAFFASDQYCSITPDC